MAHKTEIEVNGMNLEYIALGGDIGACGNGGAGATPIAAPNAQIPGSGGSGGDGGAGATPPAACGAGGNGKHC